MIHPIHNLINTNNLDTFDKLKTFIESKFNWSINEAGNLYLIKVKDRLFTPLENSLLGTIFEKGTNKVIFYGLNNFSNNLEKVGENYAVEEFIDGTQINVWYYNGWKLSTNNKIDAFNSRWGTERSFGELFEEVVDIGKLELNPRYCYSFILQHVENRIVSPINENKVWHIESRNLITGEPEYIELGLDHPRLVYLDEFIDDWIDRLPIDNEEKYSIFRRNENRKIGIEEMVKILERVNNAMDYSFPGFIVYSSDRSIRYEVKNGEYERILGIRQISPNWEYIIIDLIKNKLDNLELFDIYPEQRCKWFQMMTDIVLMKYMIYDLYYCIRVEKRYVPLESYLKSVLYEIHKIYLENVKKDSEFKITIKEIDSYFSKIDTALYMSIYKKYKENRN